MGGGASKKDAKEMKGVVPGGDGGKANGKAKKTPVVMACRTLCC